MKKIILICGIIIGLLGPELPVHAESQGVPVVLDVPTPTPELTNTPTPKPTNTPTPIPTNTPVPTNTPTPIPTNTPTPVPTNTPTPTPIPHTHEWKNKEVKVTCTTDGKTWEECECGDVRNEKITKKLGHNMTSWIVSEKATCTSSGEKYRYCKRTGCNYTEYDIIPEKGHLEVYGGKIESHEECGRCGKILSTAHTMVKEIVKAGTCTEAAEYKISCYCGYSYIEKGEISGHEYVSQVTEPTCLDTGYTTHSCKKCGDTFKNDEKAALGHKFSAWITVKEPTYEENGSKERSCERCGYVEVEIIPMLDKPDHSHEFSSYKVIDPTCTEKGYTIYICECGNQKIEDEVGTLGHDWTEWKVRIKPTCTASGEEYKICRRCEIERTNELPELGHHLSEEWVVEVAATCTMPGLKYKECVRHDLREEEEIPALGHDFDNGEHFYDEETDRGYTKYTCKRLNCEEYYIVWDEITPIPTPTVEPEPTETPIPTPTEIPDDILEDRQSKLRAITIGVTGTSGAGLLFLLLFLFWKRKKKKKNEDDDMEDEYLEEVEELTKNE